MACRHCLTPEHIPVRRIKQTDQHHPKPDTRYQRHCQTPSTGWTGREGDGLHQTSLAPNPRCPKQTPLAFDERRKRTSPQSRNVVAWQAHVPPSMTGLSACPNDASACRQSIPPANPGTPASRSSADPIRAQFGPADSRHCHASPTGLTGRSRLSLPRTNALALRTHLSRHDKHPFFVNFRRPHGPNAQPP